MYDRILVPLKGDDTDENVVTQAGGIARLSGGRVILLRVIHSHSRDETTFLEKQARAYLDGQAARLAAEGVSAEGQTEWGEPADGIAAAASALPADLIVMATHGHTEMRHVFMGSVTEDVVRSTNIPVLLVRPRVS
jgi:nucleotide-binding universal stress UspA family protein